MCPNTLAAGITAIAAAIAERREADEITLIGATLTQLGATLATSLRPKGGLALLQPTALSNPHRPPNKERPRLQPLDRSLHFHLATAIRIYMERPYGYSWRKAHVFKCIK